MKQTEFVFLNESVYFCKNCNISSKLYIDCSEKQTEMEMITSGREKKTKHTHMHCAKNGVKFEKRRIERTNEKWRNKNANIVINLVW